MLSGIRFGGNLDRAEFIAAATAFERDLQANLMDIYCPVHFALGTEEVAADIFENIQPDDWLFSYHRAHLHYMAKGGNMQRLRDEIMGLETGINGGFSGSQGFSDPSVNFHCSAIVGGLIGVAVGAALALKVDRSSAIVVCCFGDAGTEQGVCWESANFAALHKLPIVFICENNGLSVDSPIEERQARGIGVRMEAFGVHWCPQIEWAFNYTRTEGAPTFYEAKITRRADHINMATMPVGVAF